MLTSGHLGRLLSPNEADHDDPRHITDTARIIRYGQVAYIGLDSLSDAMVGAALGSILLADLTAVAGDRYNYGVGLRPVNIFIDEAPEVLNDPLIQLLNKGAGANLRLALATQTFGDIVARTGSEAKARMVLGLKNESPFLVFNDDNEIHRVLLRQSPQGSPHLDFNDPKGKLQCTLGDVVLAFFDEGKKVTWRAPR